eukprot:scaffold406_cov57-Cylindrotheca_fusiformis.AAC.15
MSLSRHWGCFEYFAVSNHAVAFGSIEHNVFRSLLLLLQQCFRSYQSKKLVVEERKDFLADTAYFMAARCDVRICEDTIFLRWKFSCSSRFSSVLMVPNFFASRTKPTYQRVPFVNSFQSLSYMYGSFAFGRANTSPPNMPNLIGVCWLFVDIDDGPHTENNDFRTQLSCFSYEAFVSYKIHRLDTKTTTRKSFL